MFAERALRRADRHAAAEHLTGKKIADLLHPDYTELVIEHLRRSLAGEPGLERLEIELHPDTEGGTRARRADRRAHRLSGRPRIVVDPDRDGAAFLPASTPARSGRPTAWETLDSLGEGIITTDVSGRIDYVNQAGEQLIGVSAVDAPRQEHHRHHSIAGRGRPPLARRSRASLPRDPVESHRRSPWLDDFAQWQ